MPHADCLNLILTNTIMGIYNIVAMDFYTYQNDCMFETIIAHFRNLYK